MLSDLNRVDINNVQEQASWVCQCDAAAVLKFEAEFKATLEEQTGLGINLYNLAYQSPYREVK